MSSIPVSYTHLDVYKRQHKNQVIEFDGCITYLTNHDNYDTRYDLLISAGDYVDENTANPGPTFKDVYKRQMCSKNAKEHECPRYWDKYKVCSDENPHECEHLIETEKL